ncbi:hypothetical protein EUGRSUZ_B03953 [Eucalyptus grandis]|uniref:Uncharacterized protein n=2 Tax=Eucalyptus grandis TaxID=71139 RepID=A0ACC3LZ04_EUCGR|nr:hypothetical protein EUGRSUZ_B03953 [Eucalyptus grandis]
MIHTISRQSCPLPTKKRTKRKKETAAVFPSRCYPTNYLNPNRKKFIISSSNCCMNGIKLAADREDQRRHAIYYDKELKRSILFYQLLTQNNHTRSTGSLIFTAYWRKSFL